MKRQQLTTETLISASPSLPTPPLLLSPTLPLDLVAEILCRLPVKSLLQLRCVCKSWKILISDSKFAKKHLRRVSSTYHHHLVLHFRTPSHEFNVVTYPIHSVFTDLTPNATHHLYPRNNHIIRFSCDGILGFAMDSRFILLYNPSIRSFKMLPPLENPSNIANTIYSFGYDPFTDNYKVVAIYCRTQVVNVHTLGTNSWRRIQDFPKGFADEESGSFVSGTVNWLASANSGDPESPRFIISLELGNETYQEVSQPDYGGVDGRYLNLGVLRDCLCIFSQTLAFTDVWLMKEHGNKDSWTKLLHVPYIEVIDVDSYTNVVCISEDDQVLLEFKGSLEWNFVVYDSRSGTFKFPEIQNISDWVISKVYVESLISPCS